MADDACSPLLDPGTVFEGMPAAALLQAWDSSPALIAVTLGRRHRLVYQNRASQTMFGSREIGTPLREAFPEV
ncbi:MAG TPA: PAS domain-containing protein, partial [Frankiaceae bacterium]|nr:PAS domain-containing protein [Frankiaceae bacterium]